MGQPIQATPHKDSTAKTRRNLLVIILLPYPNSIQTFSDTTEYSQTIPCAQSPHPGTNRHMPHNCNIVPHRNHNLLTTPHTHPKALLIPIHKRPPKPIMCGKRHNNAKNQANNNRGNHSSVPSTIENGSNL